MVTKKVIDTIYRQFNHPPQSVDELNIGLLFDYAIENHGIVIDENDLYIGSVDPKSPFAVLPLDRIHEIVEFDDVIAIVLHSSIIFLNKHNSDVNVHIRMTPPSLWSRLKSRLSERRRNPKNNIMLTDEA
ncbi:MAG: hypothetical protein HFJ95_07930 [Muribaculaceae bacterium]|nr:hypothetical protein [Muribaculaceae bacterium]